MKIANKTLAIISLIIGLGVTTSASANQDELLASLAQTVQLQGQQVSQSITKQIKETYQANIEFMAKQAAIQWNEKGQVIARNNLEQAKNKATSNK
ncbi:hypothetical protein ACOYR1_17080 [Thalassotalea piscium]